MCCEDAPVQIDEKIVGRARLARDPGDERREQRRVGQRAAVRRELAVEERLVLERPFLGVRLEEEVERVLRRHLGDEIDLDRQLGRALGEDETRDVVGLRILLPVQEMRARLDRQRVARMRERQCGAGRRRMLCGPRLTGRS